MPGFKILTDVGWKKSRGEKTDENRHSKAPFPARGNDALLRYSLSDIIRLHRMHEMQSIDTDDLSVSLSITRLIRLHCAKTAEGIELMFEVKIPGVQRILC